MVDLLQRVEFWVAMLFAVALKLKHSPQLTKSQAALTVVSAITGSLLFTEPVTHYFGFTGDSGKFACAAVVALSCEHFARMLMTVTLDQVINLWRGKAP